MIMYRRTDSLETAWLRHKTVWTALPFWPHCWISTDATYSSTSLQHNSTYWLMFLCMYSHWCWPALCHAY